MGFWSPHRLLPCPTPSRHIERSICIACRSGDRSGGAGLVPLFRMETASGVGVSISHLDRPPLPPAYYFPPPLLCLSRSSALAGAEGLQWEHCWTTAGCPQTPHESGYQGSPRCNKYMYLISRDYAPSFRSHPILHEGSIPGHHPGPTWLLGHTHRKASCHIKTAEQYLIVLFDQENCIDSSKFSPFQ